MLIGITVELSSPVFTVFTFSEFVSTIVSKLGTTGCIVVNNLFVEETEIFVSIHLDGSNNDLLLLTNESIAVSLNPTLYSLDDKTPVIEFDAFVLNVFPIFSVNLVTDVSKTES